MTWPKLKEKIYIEDGSFRDIYIQNISIQDWENWVNLVNANFTIAWYNPLSEKSESKIDFQVIKAYWAGEHDYCSTASIFIGAAKINCHFFEALEIENDIDPREFNNMQDHLKLMDYLKLISKTLGKTVILCPENMSNIVLIHVDNQHIKIDLK